MSLVILKNAQVAELTNEALKNTLGENATIITEDLEGVVDNGTKLENANAYQNFLENLMLATAKYIFRFRAYESKAPNVLRDSTEFGRLIQKIRSKMPKAENNQSWEIEPYASYDDNVYTPNEVEVKIFMKRVTFEVRKSITNDQLKDAFTSASQLGSFVSMQFGLVQNRLTVTLDDLIFMTINNFMGELIAKNTGSNEGKQVIKLLTLYKALDPNANQNLTSAKALFDKGFLIFAQGFIKDYMQLMGRYSTQFNDEGFETFTPESMMHCVLLSKFVDNASYYAESSTFHDEFIKLPYHETVAYWQGLGDKSVKDRSTINITTASGSSVNQDYIIGFLFDHDALGVNHDNPSVETKYVRSAQFTNYWYKEVLGYFNDLSENAVVFLAE